MTQTSIANSTDRDWEQNFASLIGDLTVVQTELLEVLDAKRQHMIRGEMDRAKELDPRAELLIERLQACHERRTELLSFAAERGMPSSSLGKLATKASVGNRGKLVKQVNEASSRTRLLHHHCLATWVLAQRSLLHVAQMLEIIATGGRLQPTYGKVEPNSSGGALVDHEA